MDKNEKNGHKKLNGKKKKKKTLIMQATEKDS